MKDEVDQMIEGLDLEVSRELKMTEIVSNLAKREFVFSGLQRSVLLEIYLAGSFGITTSKIAEGLNQDRIIIEDEIRAVMIKGFPIQLKVEGEIKYCRLANNVIEMQARENILGLSNA